MLKKLYVKMRQQLRNGNKKQWSKESLPQASLMQMLEPRLMFDGAAVETVNISDSVSAEEQNYILNAINDNEQAKATATLLNAIEKGAENLQIDYSQFKEVVIIDARVEDPHVLIQNISREAAVEVIATSKDGVDEIASILQKYQNLDAVHIISHGDQGELHLGNIDLNLSNIASYAAQLGQWGQALTQSGDILFYGCDVAEGLTGQRFIDQLKSYTNADIAASIDATGYSANNADAELEVKQNVNVSEIVNFNQYQYVLNANVEPTISELLELKDVASDGAANDFLGNSVKVSDDGSTMVVGAHGEDDKGSAAGAVYIYSWDGSNWTGEEKLTASDGAANDYFGWTVDISEDGNTILVSAYGDDDKGSNAGSAYIYKRDNSSSPWVETKILAIGGVADDHFGYSLALSGNGNTAVVSSRLDDDGGTDSGSVYIYQYNGVAWQFLTKQVASDDVAASDYFGVSVDIAADGRTVVVGAWYDDDYGTNSGAAYIYDFNGISWSETQKITASDGSGAAGFGSSVSISSDGKSIVVGAPYNDGAAGGDSGAAYLYQYDGAIWQEVEILKSSDLAASDQFGYSVSITEDGKRMLVGARYDDDSSTNSGSVYTYAINNVAALDSFTVDEGHKPINITGLNKDVFVSDTVNFNGGSLLLTNTALVEDNFSIENQGTGTSQISLSGNDVYYEGNLIGVIDGTLTGQAGSNLLINFTEDAASSEALTALVHAVQYHNTSVAPQAAHNLSITITDAEGGVSNTVTQTINVAASDNVTPIIGDLAELETVASDREAYDYFGRAIAISDDGSTMVASSYGDDDNGSAAGAIYVYEWDGSSWVNEQKLTAADGVTDDYFGYAVDISADGNTIIVGAYLDDDKGSNSGSAYIYTRADNTSPWSAGDKITALAGAANDWFGFSVAISGDGLTAVVSGKLDDDNGTDSGSVYVYRFNGAVWNVITKQTASDGAANDFFGESVDVSYDGNTFVVGTPLNDDAGTDSGSAYVYQWDADESQFVETKFVASDDAGADHFGISVSVAADGKTVVVGSRYDDDTATDSGSAYVYDFDGIKWNESQKLNASDAGASDYFGHSVTISADGKTIVVGAYANDSVEGANTGSAYLFKYDGELWQETKILTSINPAAGEDFATAVAISGDGNKIAVDAHLRDNNGVDSGSVYTYVINDVVALDAFTADEEHDPIRITGANPEIFVTDTVRFDGGYLLLTNSGFTGDNFTVENQGSGTGEISVSGSDIAYEGVTIGVIDGTLNGLSGNNLRIDFTTSDANAEALTALVHALQYQNTALDPEAVRNISFAIFDAEGASTATITQTINVVAIANVDPIIAEVSEVKTIASDGQINDNYGEHMAVSADGSTLVVGSFADDNGTDSGAIYVYEWDGSNWFNEEKLLPIDGAANDHFLLVSISDDGNTILVGADWDDDNGSNSGAVYIYTRSDKNTPWGYEKITPNDGAANDNFGYWSAISGDGNTAVIGARYDDDKGTDSGSIYVYRFDGTDWNLLSKQTASDGAASDYFGDGVAVSQDGNIFAVGAHADDDKGSASGSVYVYTWDAANTQFVETKLTASDGAADDHFGGSVAMSANGKTMVVSSRYDDDNGSNSGSAYVYDFDGTEWHESQKLTASNGSADDIFGWKVAISSDGKTIVVGANGDDDTQGANTGAAYLYKYDGVLWKEIEILKASDAAAGDELGSSVAITADGNKIIVGARYDDNSATNTGSVYTYLVNEVASLEEFTLAEEHDPVNITALNPDIFVSDTIRFNGGSLLLTNTNVAEDNFSIENQGVGAGQISISGNNISYEGNIIGVIDGTSNGSAGSNLLINFTTDDASSEAVTALVHAIQYQNTSLSPNGDRSISLSITDSEGAVSNTITQSIKMLIENVGPVITSTAPVVATEDELYTYTATVIDPDDLNNGTDLVWSLINAPAGMEVSNTGVVTWTPGEGVTTSGVVTLQVQDGLEDFASPATEDFTITVTPVNDAPTAANNTVSTNEDTDYVFSAVDFNFSDVDGDALTSIQVTALEAVGALKLNGTDVTLNQVISKADIDAGLLIFTPQAEAAGVPYDSFSFSVSDGTTDSAASYTMSIDVVAVNDAPTAANNTVSTNEDTDYVFSAVDFNFSDVDGDALASIQVTALETVGALKLNGTDVTLNQVISKADIDAGLLIFTPLANANGIGYDSFGFTVNDGTVDSASSYTITIDVNAVNDAPTAANNTVSTNEDTDYVFSAVDFNFSDIDGDTLASIQVTALETVGALKLNGTDVTLNQVISKADIDSGLLVFTPQASATGIPYDGFNFSVNDGTTDSATSYTMSINVVEVNDAPTAANNTVSTNEDTDYVFSAVDFNFSDIEGDTLASIQVTALETVGALKLNGTDVTLNQVISKADIDSGLLVFTPQADANGAGYDSFEFSVNDGTLDSVVSYTMNISIIAVNDAPTAANSTVSTNEDTDYVFSAVDFNFSDVEGDTLASIEVTALETVGALKLNGTDVTLNQVISKADIDAGLLIFTPLTNANGAGYDSFDFTVNDGTTDSASSYTMSIDVVAVNDAPTAANNTVSTNEDTDYVFSAVDFNFSDIEGDTLASIQVTALETAGALKLNGTDVTLNQVISKADIDSGLLVFTPQAEVAGIPYDSFSFSVNDGTTDSAASYTMSIDVVAVNDAPTAANSTVSTNEDTDYVFSAVDFNFSDIEGDALASIQVTALETVGALKLNGTDVTLNQVISKADIDAGLLTFIPQGEASGIPYDSFSFSVNDGTTDSAASYTMSIDVVAVNDAPTAANSTVSTNEDTDYVFSAVDFNFSDIEGDTLASIQVTALETVGALKLNGTDVTLNQVISKADIDSGLLVFTPQANANGAGYDSFEFSVNDGVLDSVTSYTMTIDVAAVNDAPTAANNTVSTNEDTDYIFSAVDFNFSDIEGSTLASIQVTALETAGALKLNGTDVTLNQVISKADIDAGLLTFIPQAEAVGIPYDSFSFSVNDGTIDSAASYTMSIDVIALGDAPTAANNTVNTNEDTDYIFSAVDFNFSDVDGDTLASIQVTTLETVGALKLNGTDVTLNQVISKADIDAGLLTFTPLANANGVGYDSFDFMVNDGVLDSVASYTMTIDVVAVNDAPTAANNTVSTNEDTDYVFSAVDFNFSDIDGDTLASIQVTALETVGALKLNGTDVTLNQVISKADIDAGLLTFSPQGEASGIPYDSFSFSVNDGTTDSAASYTMSIDVVAVNDAPTAANNTVSTNEDTDYVFSAVDFNFSDIDGDTLASIQVTALETVGALKLNGTDVTLNQVISKADIDSGLLVFTPQANANGAGYDSFGFTVNDGTVDSASGYTITIDVVAVDDVITTDNGDGTTSFDLNGDGEVDVTVPTGSTVVDNGDGTVSVDTTGNGQGVVTVPSGSTVTNNSDGTVNVDVNSDGQVDATVTKDAIIKINNGILNIDLDGDGQTDLFAAAAAGTNDNADDTIVVDYLDDNDPDTVGEESTAEQAIVSSDQDEAPAVVEVADVNDNVVIDDDIAEPASVVIDSNYIQDTMQVYINSPSLIKNDFLAFFNRLQDYGLDTTVIFETMVDKVFASGLNNSQIAEILSEIMMSLDESNVSGFIDIIMSQSEFTPTLAEAISKALQDKSEPLLQQAFDQQTADGEVENADNTSTADSAPQAEITANLSEKPGLLSQLRAKFMGDSADNVDNLNENNALMDTYKVLRASKKLLDDFGNRYS